MRGTCTLLLFFLFTSLGALWAQNTTIHRSPSRLATVDTTTVATLAQQISPQSGLKLAQVISSPVASYWHFQQLVNGLPLYGASLKVKVDRNGSVLSIDHLDQGAHASERLPGFALSEREVQAQWAARETEGISFLEPSYLRHEGQLRPVYRVESFSPDGSESHEVLIDAANGAELLREDRVAHFMGDTTGRARVFVPNPCTASGVMYGSLFSDNNDQHMPAFEPYIDTVLLRDLRYDNGTFYLEGPYVRIEDLASNTIAPVTSSNGDFFYNRDHEGFEDAMCYYHVDTYQRYVQSLGFLNLWGATPLKVDPHGMGNADNSSFVPNGLSSSLRFGEGGVDDAEDADVIIHEYGHALSYAAAPDTRIGTQRRGLDEGYGDYFAASYSYDLRSDYGWDLMMNWDGHNEFWSGRNTLNPDAFDPSNSDIWELGEIWASTMMEIRYVLGAGVTDRLQLEALYGNVAYMTFEEAAWLVIDADSSYYNGAHVPVLAQYFCQRNILNGDICTVVSIDDELPGLDTKWEVFPNPNTGSFTARLKPGEQPSPQQELILLNSLGQILARSAWNHDTEVQFNLSLPPGMYLLTLVENGNLLGRKKVVIF